MSIGSKIGTAASLLRREGLVVLLKESGRRFLGLGNPRPDEAEIIFCVYQKRHPGLMIDAGAHFGSALRPFADAGWKVFAFEPDPQNRTKLQDAFGSYANVIIDPRGLSDEPQDNVPFYTSGVSTGISSLSAFHPSHTASCSIELTTLDRFCADKKIQQVHFLKIDTEGFDLFVLRGIPWETLAPDIVLCEFEDTKTAALGYSFHDLARFLQQKGYRLVVSEWYPIRKYGGLHDWRRFAAYPCDLKEGRAWGNIMAARTDDLFNSLMTACKRYGPVENSNDRP
jgi:FkbM family methyltransferase